MSIVKINKDLIAEIEDENRPHEIKFYYSLEALKYQIAGKKKEGENR